MNDQNQHNPAETHPTEPHEPVGPACPACSGSRGMLWLGLIVVAMIFIFISLKQSQGGGAATAGTAIPWADSYESGMSEAAEQGKPTFIAFKADWCGPCQQMKKNVFSQEAAAKVLDGWVPIHVDVDQQKRIAERYKVNMLPTFMALTPEGEPLLRIEGYLPLEELAQFIASAEAKLPETRSPTAGF